MRRGILPALLFVVAGGGTLFLGSRILASERSSAERTARERLRAQGREAAGILVAEATRALRNAPSGRVHAVLGPSGLRFTEPEEPVALGRLKSAFRRGDEEEIYLSAAQKAEVVDGNLAEAEKLYRMAMSPGMSKESKGVALYRLASLYRRTGRVDDAIAAEKDYLALSALGPGRDGRPFVLEHFVIRIRHPDAGLPADLLRTLGSGDDSIPLGLLHEAGVPERDIAARREELLLLDRLRPELRTIRNAGEGVRIIDGRLVAWTATRNELADDPEWRIAIHVAPVPPLPHGARTLPHVSQWDRRLHEFVEVGEPLRGVTVQTSIPLAAVEAEARRGAWLLGGALATLLLAGGAAVTLSVRAARREAEAARARADFVTKVGHDLRTPLAVVRMYAETLAAGKVADPAEAREFASVAAREAERLTGMVGQVLDLSRVAEPALPRASLDLAALAAEVAEVHRPLLAHAGIRLEVRAAGPLPVVGDSASLRGAVSNLLENAARHAADGGSVGIEADRRGTMAEVRVLDRGPGLPPGMEERVFERFVRGPGAGGSGAGLGLALVREAAEAHGGAARASNREGGGAVFAVSVPLAEEGS